MCILFSNSFAVICWVYVWVNVSQDVGLNQRWTWINRLSLTRKSDEVQGKKNAENAEQNTSCLFSKPPLLHVFSQNCTCPCYKFIPVVTPSGLCPGDADLNLLSVVPISRCTANTKYSSTFIWAAVHHQEISICTGTAKSSHNTPVNKHCHVCLARLEKLRQQSCWRWEGVSSSPGSKLKPCSTIACFSIFQKAIWIQPCICSLWFLCNNTDIFSKHTLISVCWR